MTTLLLIAAAWLSVAVLIVAVHHAARRLDAKVRAWQDAAHTHPVYAVRDTWADFAAWERECAQHRRKATP